MTSPDKRAISDWMTRHESTYEDLRTALAAVPPEAAACASKLSGTTSEENDSALLGLSASVATLLHAVERARILPPIPDADAQLFFVAFLERWQEACITLVDALVDQDLPRLHQAAHGLGDGVDDLYRYASALRRANGQAPDPGNPFN